MTVKSPVPAAAGIRLLMIGLDSPNLRHIRGALHRLPNLRHIFESGVQFDLASSADCLDASAWPTFYTGSLPGEHGLYHPMQWDAAGMRMRRLSADWIYAEPFWYALARQGVRVISADVPMVNSENFAVARAGVHFHCVRNKPGVRIRSMRQERLHHLRHVGP